MLVRSFRAVTPPLTLCELAARQVLEPCWSSLDTARGRRVGRLSLAKACRYDRQVVNRQPATTTKVS
jgi:hypothetical protein